jgi:cupin fold WbuC family metalloprotein
MHLKQLSNSILDELSRQAQNSPRRRANHNLHEDLSDPIQRLAIAMEPDTLVLPHRHPHTWELLYPLRGRFVVLHFDETGTVISRALLGEDCRMIENPAGIWHAVLSLDSGGIIFEVKHGPYTPLGEADVMLQHVESIALNRWYAGANIGDRLPSA